MPCAAAPSTSWERSPTISTRSGSGSSWASAWATTSAFDARDAVEAGARDHLEMLVEPEVLEDPPRRRFGLRRGHRQPHARGPQVGQQVRNPVEQAVHRPAAGGVVGPVGGDRRVGPLAEPHRPQRVVHRRSDDQARQVAVGHVGADLAQRMAEAGDDAVGGIGQGAVEVEDHQLRAGRHGSHCPRRPTTVVMWQVTIRARVRAITATRPRRPACWTSPSTCAPTSRRPG